VTNPPHRELSVDEAREHILAAFAPLPAETVVRRAALGRILAEPVIAAVNLPPFDNSAMDGYAVRAADVAGAASQPVQLQVIGSVPAGSGEPQTIRSGACARIMTGAPLPAGADAVIPFERVAVATKRAIEVNEPVAPGACVRRAGEDLRAGDRLLESGARIGPAALALLSAADAESVRAHRKPKAAVLVTGDEIARSGSPVSPGQIRDGNSPALLAMIDRLGAAPIDLGVARDDAAELRERFEAAREAGVDLLITTGGVSAGDFDVVKQVMRAHGEFEEWRVRMRPGRPLAFGTIGALPVIGLPGNPVAAFVAFVQFARPAILKMMGVPRNDWLPPELPVIVRDEIDNRGGRRTFARVGVTRGAEGYEARLAGPQGSANLLTLARANGLLVIPDDVELVQPGMRLMAQMPGWRFDEL
jgi:molybdopterin molybdotransferase